MKKILFLITSIFFNIYSYGAYLRNVPITLTQPNGTVINCFATGDEFYNWAHDSLGYTIVQSPTNGYYYYAILNNDSLVCSSYVVGNVLPQSVGLQPYINISEEKIRERVNAIIQSMQQQAPAPQRGSINTGTLNNIVIYIRFNDQPDFSVYQDFTYRDVFQAHYTSMFNNKNIGANSMRNYFQEVSYQSLDVVSHFFPVNNGTTILSYKDSKNRSYYCKKTATNPDGYTNSERTEREHTLLYNAINYVKNQIPSNLDVDIIKGDDKDKVDNICFIIRGGPDVEYINGPAGCILWSHKWVLSKDIKINGKTVVKYNIILEREDNGAICHEMNHTLGAPDLYHKAGGSPVWQWDLMGICTDIPTYTGAYMRYKYGGWISSISEITTSGNYTLQPLSSAFNNCYKISIQGSSQYIVVEYRKKISVFESYIPGCGMLIYRIDERYKGNYYEGVGYCGVQGDEVYIFRPNCTPSYNGDIEDAYFSDTSGRTVFSNSTNPFGCTSNGNYANIYVKNIRENPNGTLSFDVRFCDNNNITYSNTSNLPVLTNASNNIQTTGTVIVKSTDNVTFEAGNKVILNPGFKIELGGKFKINMNECGE